MTIREFVENAVAELEAAHDRAWQIIGRPRYCGWCGHTDCSAHADLDDLLYRQTNAHARSHLDGLSAGVGRR